MRYARTLTVGLLALLLVLATVIPSQAVVNVQCPGDTDGDAVIDVHDPNRSVKCMHLGAGDGYSKMADGTVLYTFGFTDLTGIPPASALDEGYLAMTQPAPSIILDEGDELYLSLTNVGMVNRPDLFDPHTVHYHGFPNASAVFDGVPDNSIAINMGSTLTYYYLNVLPGTYMYHCHVEATEHMQMGMLGNLYVRPGQNRFPDGTVLGSWVHHNPDYNASDPSKDDPLNGDKYAYNDGDGSTRYDVEVALQLGSFDREFHNASESVQPLPFQNMKDDYAMINGRGYPDTTVPGALPPPTRGGVPMNATAAHPSGFQSQKVDSRIVATAGQRILLRISNLNVTRFYTISTPGLPMTVVGKDARILRDASGNNLYYTTSSITLGGGEAYDVIIDTNGIPPGTYVLYTTNLNYLSNDQEDFGGMMTEIVIN